MIGKLVLDYLGSYWREAAIVGLVLALLVAFRARDNALVARGQAQEQARVADSTLHALKPVLARTDTLVVHDTLRVTRLVPKLETLRDTVLSHLTDTIIVKQYVAVADSMRQACSELTHDCAAFRQNAQATIRALEAKLAVQVPKRSCVMPSLVSAGVGLAGGFLLHR